jgi:hypothetical protein
MSRDLPMSLEPQAQRNLLMLASRWCYATGNTMTTCANYSGLDPAFFEELAKRSGPRKPDDKKGSFTFRIYDRTVAWFHDLKNWPDKIDSGRKDEWGKVIYRKFQPTDIPDVENLDHHKRKR